jgi:predicted phage terminase large subunit-like protein
MTIDRATADAIYRQYFAAFVCTALPLMHPGATFVPNWHIEAVCWRLQTMFAAKGRTRLIINQPPRSLKSSIASVCLPAWLLGIDPTLRIICASYSDDLARKFSRETRTLMETGFYKRIFPRSRLNPRKCAEGEFETTAQGYRMATSVGGTLTGRGGDVLIIDDPLKANDAYSEVARENAIEWFSGTAMSRLDQPGKGKVIVVMQRLHADDLSGHLIEKGWPKLVLPAIATKRTRHVLGEKKYYTRWVDEVLQKRRDKLETLNQLRADHGSHMFAAQYQQDPTPPEGNRIKVEWLERFDPVIPRTKFRRVVLACDPAAKTGAHNDYTAIAVIGVLDKCMHLLEVQRGRWEILQSYGRITALAEKWRPDMVIVEDTSSGSGLIQILRQQTKLNVAGRHPKDDKETRLLRQQGRFETGRILFPKEAPWLADFEQELLGFPLARHDDQVDALLLLMEWFDANESRVVFVGPIILTTPKDIMWSGRW